MAESNSSIPGLGSIHHIDEQEMSARAAIFSHFVQRESIADLFNSKSHFTYRDDNGLPAAFQSKEY